ncbi:hypothetical protein C7999DRAFT_33934 [Corynascus novoguineensis]|uniref:BTB domain-containing protein n=1 Tax=Corynascus novoguineensis TaxID=1126955 RepID=A0AAN7HN51_9PEZI|nr:hypothetical protein C7999DRAFT_33934 [Corynascus novoguineensis]
MPLVDRLYSSGEYSDLVISCRREEYHVHRAIVCTQSEFFAAACRTSFKEAQEGKVDLPDDDPRLVHIMIHYLYHFDYDLDLQPKQTSPSAAEMDGPLYTHASIYALGEKYLIRGLKTVALRKFRDAATAVVDVDDFVKATLEVYTSTVEDDRGLRDAVVKTLYENSDWLEKENVQDALKNVVPLAYDLVMYIRQHRIF